MHDCRIQITDLPGVYSISSTSTRAAVDVRITAEFLSTQPVDLIVNVLDSTHLERNL